MTQPLRSWLTSAARLRSGIRACSIVFILIAANNIDAAPPIVKITISPASVEFQGALSRQQLIVTGHLADSNETIDLTRDVTFDSLTPSIAVVSSDGLVLPRGFGEATIGVRYRNSNTLRSTLTVFVREFGGADPVHFDTDVAAALCRSGCNSGACHGAPQGKNGFRLSLRGSDPTVDFTTLARETLGRRTNSVAPDESLVLKKPLGIVPHQGGVRFQKTDAAYQVLRRWIAEGCRPSVVKRELKRLEVLPARRRLTAGFPEQQLIAIAHFEDGTSRDVSHLAVFSANDDSKGSISKDGLVKFTGTAEATFLVRYLGQIVGSRITYVEPDADFKFHSPPANNFVDAHVFAKQRDLQIVPAEVTTDAVFLRRVFLDTIGTLPSADEATRFLDSKDADKRGKLIDQLLTRDEFAYVWAMKWADIMRGSDVTISKRGVHNFHRYLVERFRHDRPFDEFARESLTSLGDTLNRPAANFHRVARTPEDAAEAMSQLFLGVRIGCAKCHNHPFEAITQGDYYGFAAYFARVKFKGQQFMRDDEIVYLSPNGEVRHPVTNKNVAPVAFGDSTGELDPTDDRREKLVEWLVRPENPFFARSIVNRLWFHLLGQGIVDPVDDFRDTNPPSNEELLDALAAEFVKSGFRIKPVLKVILNSNTYQLSSQAPPRQSPHAANPNRYFAHARVQMLQAEPILDAISTTTGIPEQFKGYPIGTRAIELAGGSTSHSFLKAFSKPVRDATCECGRDPDPSLSQVIHMLNNPTIVQNIRSPNGRIRKWLAAGKPAEEVVELIYLTTLSRRQTSQERALILRHLETVKDVGEGLFDVQFALMNSNEFLLRH
ncbi:MAG: DUF1553 domain-containing protein [Planctomycetota bacterium]|nr:DUF1553 domain-containing protein [Planctomycetota bacterium]